METGYDFSERIIREAERKASAIIEEARNQADKIIKDALEQWTSKAEATRKQIVEEALRQANIILADAKREASIIVASAKQEVINEVFEKARSILHKREYDVKQSLRNLIIEGLAYIKTLSKIVVNPNDVEVAKEILNELGYSNVEIETDDKMPGGVILVSSEGTVVNNSIEVRLKQAELRLLDKIAKSLWG